jgi:hypothetical protein
MAAGGRLTCRRYPKYRELVSTPEPGRPRQIWLAAVGRRSYQRRRFGRRVSSISNLRNGCESQEEIAGLTQRLRLNGKRAGSRQGEGRVSLPMTSLPSDGYETSQRLEGKTV